MFTEYVRNTNIQTYIYIYNANFSATYMYLVWARSGSPQLLLTLVIPKMRGMIVCVYTGLFEISTCIVGSSS